MIKGVETVNSTGCISASVDNMYVSLSHMLPGISWLKLTFRKGPLLLLKLGTLAVMERLV